MPSLPNPAAIRQALTQLLEAKKLNKRYPDMDMRADDGSSGTMPTTGTLVEDARAQARTTQGTDPLSVSNREYQGSEASGAFPDQPVSRRMTRPQSPLSVLDDGPSRRGELNDANIEPQQDPNWRRDQLRSMEDEFVALQNEFERLAGRPPTPEEMKDIGTLENLVDILKDASGEVKVKGDASNWADTLDDIPF